MSKDADNNNTNTYVANDPDVADDTAAKPKPKLELYTETLHKTAKKTRKTLPKPTRYERARIIGVRTTQIASGAAPKTDVKGLTDPYLMAVKEFEDGKSPLIIQRRLPGGEVETVRVSELI